MILETIHSPSDVKALDKEQLPLLCQELREFLVDRVSRTGGHLASNLGAVELTVAIHRVFDTAQDRLVFDVGHQCYVHKALTGRQELFSTLRQFEGLSGFPKPCESVHDAFIAGHASNSVSVALGMARARTLQKKDYHVLALIGDGALTGGLAYEGMNNAGASGEPLIVILNDNGMSINQNVGGMSRHLNYLRSRPAYYHFKKWYRGLFGKEPAKSPVYRFNHRVKTALKKALLPGSTLFEDMGFTYLGPVDGHDLTRLCDVLQWARELNGPVLLHVKTVKGKGYPYAERNPDRFHGVGPFDPETGLPKPGGESFSAVFGRTLTECAGEDGRVCAITAAMADGVGLEGFQKTYPKRFFDVGIAEAHGVTFAAGLAKAGLRPYVAVYSSFLQRAYDQMLEDVCLQNLPVTFCIDRAGAVGADGETHHGLFDIAYMRSMPNMTVFAPKDGPELEAMLELSLKIDGPCAIRYPRGTAADLHAACADAPGKAVRLKEGNGVDLWAVGNMTEHALAAAEMLQAEGIDAGVVNTASVKPLDLDMLHASASSVPLIVTIEDGIVSGGIGEAIKAGVSQQDTEVINLGWPDQFIEHGTQNELYEKYGLDARSIAETVKQNIK